MGAKEVEDGLKCLPSYCDVKWESDEMGRHYRWDVVLLVVDSADDGQQSFLHCCLELCVTPSSNCTQARSWSRSISSVCSVQYAVYWRDKQRSPT